MRASLPRTVIVLGVVSLLNDLASDIVIPLIPILLATILGAGPVALGLIEGVADAVASLLKLWSGRHSDSIKGRRKMLALSGYTLSNIARPLLGLAGSWVTVLLLRSLDRVGKGIRSAPRDALLVDATPLHMRGYAFGFHRAMDNGGAVGGALLAAAVLAWSSISLPNVILLSAIPGFLAVMLIGTGIKHDRSQAMISTPLPPLRWNVLALPMRRYLVVLSLFTFARASETFIVLLGYQLGGSIVELLLLWAMLNLAKTLTSTWGGRLADQFGRTRLLLLSWSAFAVSFALYGVATRMPMLWLITIGYGLLMGMSEGAERALISDYADAEQRGTAFGWYHLIVGIAAIPAGLLFGGLWHYCGYAVAFYVAAALAGLSAITFFVWVKPLVEERQS